MGSLIHARRESRYDNFLVDITGARYRNSRPRRGRPNATNIGDSRRCPGDQFSAPTWIRDGQSGRGWAERRDVGAMRQRRQRLPAWVGVPHWTPGATPTLAGVAQFALAGYAHECYSGQTETRRCVSPSLLV